MIVLKSLFLVLGILLVSLALCWFRSWSVAAVGGVVFAVGEALPLRRVARASKLRRASVLARARRGKA